MHCVKNERPRAPCSPETEAGKRPSFRPRLTLGRTQVVSAGCLLLSPHLSPCLVLTASALPASSGLTRPRCLSSSSVLPKSFSFPGRPPWASVLQLLPKPQRALSNCKSHCTWSMKSYNNTSQRLSHRCIIVSSNDTRMLVSLVSQCV